MDENNETRGKGFILGLLLIIVGLLLLSIQVLTTLVTVFVVGAALSIGGILEIAHGVTLRKRTPEVIGGFINLIVGVVLLLFPALSAVTLTFLIAVSMIVLGIYRTILGFSNINGRGWNIAGGLITLLLGLWILAGWPASGLFVIGIFVGIELIVSGILTLIIVSQPQRLENFSPSLRYASDIKKSPARSRKRRKT